MKDEDLADESCGSFGVLAALDQRDKKSGPATLDRKPVITLERGKFSIQCGVHRYEKMFYEMTSKLAMDMFWKYWVEKTDLSSDEIVIMRVTLDWWGLTSTFGWDRNTKEEQ